MAEVDEVEIDIPESDIEIEVYRSSGAGGQNVQKNSTAVRSDSQTHRHGRHLPGRALAAAKQIARPEHSARAPL